jgi:endogenous inhibitor of DNA gyrase (YacG/DUF329 family)
MSRNEQGCMGGGKFCICLECGTRIPRQNNVTCLESNCPKCNAVMVREGSPYHRYAVQRRRVMDLEAKWTRRGTHVKSRKQGVPDRSAEEQNALGEFSFS